MIKWGKDVIFSVFIYNTAILEHSLLDSPEEFSMLVRRGATFQQTYCLGSSVVGIWRSLQADQAAAWDVVRGDCPWLACIASAACNVSTTAAQNTQC